jgi:hypothetical protein
MQVIMASLMILLPTAVLAQAQPAALAAQGELSGLIGSATRAMPDTAPLAGQQPLPTVAVAQRPRRRGSMVGYIDDATIGTRLRVRYEAAFRNEVPDRAEFFYAKCGCFRYLPADHPAHDPHAPGPGESGVVPNHIDYQQLVLTGEIEVTDGLSAFVHLPLRRVRPEFAAGEAGAPEPSFDSQSGIADIRIGAKYGVVAEEDRTVTLQVQAHLMNGDPARGMGTSHNSIEPALLYFQRVGERLGLEAQGGVWMPFGRSAGVPTDGSGTFAGAVLFAGIGPSYEIYRTETLQLVPVLELLAWQVLSGHQTAPSTDAGGTNIVNLKLGARTTFGKGSIYIGYGTALTDASWYDEILRVEYRHNF